MCSQDHSLNDKLIKAKTGAKIRIHLKGYGVTGYKWHILSDSSKVAIKRLAVKGDTKLLGGSLDDEIVEIEPLASGETTLQFDLLSPWSKDTAESHSIKLITDDDIG